MNDSPVDCQNTSVTEPQREGRAIAVGGVGGVLGIGGSAESFLHYYKGLEPCDKLRAFTKDTISDTLRLTKLPVGQFGIFFLRCLTHRISRAKSKNSPSVPPFGRRRLLREGFAGERTAGERENKKKRPPLVISFLVGSPCWTRTSDTLINSQVLYRLS